MRVPISLITLSAACLIAGCATAYQPDGVSGGYSDKVAGNTAQVTFRGNRLTTPATVDDFLLRRCAEVTLQDGYKYFVVAQKDGPNVANTDAFGSNVRTATIEMYQSKPQGGLTSMAPPTCCASFLPNRARVRSQCPPPVQALR